MVVMYDKESSVNIIILTTQAVYNGSVLAEWPCMLSINIYCLIHIYNYYSNFKRQIVDYYDVSTTTCNGSLSEKSA